MGSIDRPVRPDQPDPPERPDQPERPDRPGTPDRGDRPDRSDGAKAPGDFDAKLTERLSTLTRASAYERLYTRAQAQDAPLRERLSREEPAKPKDSLSADKPERDLEPPRTYWTEVPRFSLLWQKITDHWPARKKKEPESSLRNSEQDAETLLASEKISQREPSISVTR